MDFSGVPALRSLSSLMGGADDPDTEEAPEPETDGGVATVGGQATQEVEIPAGAGVSLSVPEGAEIDTEAIEAGLPEAAAERVTVQGQTNDGDGMTVNPIAESDSKRLGGYFSELFTEFDRIQDPKIEKLRENRVDYNERVGKWILTEDDRVPAILNNQVGLILGQEGLQAEPEDPDNDADVKTAEFLQDLYDGEHEDLPHVDPRDVTRQIMAQNYLSARSVVRSTDLAELPLESLTYYRDPEDSTEYYVQDAMSYKKLEPDPDAAGGFRTTRDSTDEQLLELGEHVFDAHLFRTKPLKAIADLVVNKMVLQRLMARKAEIASVGGLYVKVEPPAWLSESAYEDQVEDPENDGETISKLELHMREGVNDAFETLQDYQSGFIMSIPSHWTVEQIEVPETGEPMADQIRAYNKSIAARLMFPLDLMELREGAELSRDTLFRTLLNTIAGWRREVLGVFDEFARVQKEIHDLNGDVDHTLPKLETEDEELLIQALNFAGLAGLSTKEIRQTFNRIEGYDLDEQAPEDPAQQQGGPAPGGPQDPEERRQSMEDVLNPGGGDEDADEDGPNPEEDGVEDGVQASRSDLLEGVGDSAFTPPEGLDMYEMEGWDQTSVWDAFLSLGGTHSTCSTRMTGELRNPDAWCAALKDQALGTDLWRSGSGAFAGDEEPTVYAQEASGYEFDGSLDDFADAVESALGDVTRLQSEDDYVAFSPGGAEPGDDGFSPVVVIDAGDGEFQISGASEDDLSGLDERLNEAAAAKPFAVPDDVALMETDDLIAGLVGDE